jgi:NAD(P)-dependent dehydrogenase (short-subunit alcohol dehydrogenase family)
MPRTTLITGANRGIGLELCRQAHGAGDNVIAVCRSASEPLDALGVAVEAGVDIASDVDVSSLATRLAGHRIDLLINNAGFYRRDTLADLDLDQVRRHFEVNAMGPLRVTQQLRPLLSQGAKLAFITSRVGSIGDNRSGRNYAYRMSKAALNMAAVSLSIDLRDRNIAVAVLHPGSVRTDMNPGGGATETADAARGLLDRIAELTLETSGGFWHANGERLPW